MGVRCTDRVGRAWTRLFLLLLALLGFAAPAVMARAPQELGSDRAAVAAYRAGDLETARTLWEEALAAPDDMGAAERARLCYNLGNVSARQDQHLRAVAWYTAALRLRPRDADTWANLELARLAAELSAADRGDLKATVERLLSSLTRAESSWFALLCLLPLAVALGFEATRGGRLWRWTALLGLFVALLGSLPWLKHRLASEREPLMIVSEESVSIRSEPRGDADQVDELEPGEIVLRRDVMADWTSVELDSGRGGWLPTRATFRLNR